MGITLKIDDKGIQTKLDRAANKTVPDQLVKELNIFVIKTHYDAAAAVPVDEGFLRNSIKPVLATQDNLKASVIVAANYAAFVEFGTRSFAAAYVSSLPQTWQGYAASFKGKSGGTYNDFILRLMGWIKRKGIDQKLAYPIARKIMRTGIKARPFLFPAVQKNYAELLNRLK